MAVVIRLLVAGPKFSALPAVIVQSFSTVRDTRKVEDWGDVPASAEKDATPAAKVAARAAQADRAGRARILIIEHSPNETEVEGCFGMNACPYTANPIQGRVAGPSKRM